MLTIKKQARECACVLLLVSVGFWSGCGDPGARALLEGEKLVQQGQYQQAVLRLTDAVDRLPQNAQAWNHLGLAYHHAGRPQKAAEAYQTALRLDRNLAVTRHNLGCLYFDQARFALASEEFGSYTQLAPRELQGWLKLGRAQLREAMRSSGAEKTRWLNLARKSFDTSLALAATAEAYNAVGMIEVLRSQPRNALKFFKAALEREPNYPPALLNLAIVYHQHLNDRRAALQKYREFLVVQPRSSGLKAIEDIAHSLDQELSPPATVSVKPPATPPAAAPVTNVTSKPVPKTESTPARNLTPSQTAPAIASVTSNPPPSQQIANVPVKTNKAPNAPTAFPSTAPTYKYTITTKPLTGNRREAVRHFEEGTTAERQSDLRKALSAYQNAVSADPSLYEGHFKIGILAYKTADYVTSMKAYETALAISPDSSSARFNFALALMKGGYTSDAVGELQKVISHGPADAKVHLTLANLYSQNQQNDLARTHYSKVLELEPRHPEAMAIRYWLKENEAH